MTALVIAEHDNNELKPGVAQAVSAAGQAGGETHVLVAGAHCAGAAAAAARLQGVSRVGYRVLRAVDLSLLKLFHRRLKPRLTRGQRI